MAQRRWWQFWRWHWASTKDRCTFEPLTPVPDGDVVLGASHRGRWRDLVDQQTIAPDEARHR